MSEQRTNFMTVGAAVAIVFGLIGWFSFSSDDTAETVAENGVQTEQETIQVNNTETPDEVVEEIIVVADELVEKAQEAADRNQANADAEVEDAE
jgi:hypothetical protein